MNKKINQKHLDEMVKKSILKHINESKDLDGIPNLSSEEDIDEETKFYKELGECCENALTELNNAQYLIEICDLYNIDAETDTQLKIITKNLEHICDRLSNLWDEYDD